MRNIESTVITKAQIRLSAGGMKSMRATEKLVNAPNNTPTYT